MSQQNEPGKSREHVSSELGLFAISRRFSAKVELGTIGESDHFSRLLLRAIREAL